MEGTDIRGFPFVKIEMRSERSGEPAPVKRRDATRRIMYSV